MDKFIDSYKLPMINQDDINNLNRSIITKDKETVTTSLLSKTNARPDRLIIEFYYFKCYAGNT